MKLYKLNRSDNSRDLLFRSIEEYIYDIGLVFSSKIDDNTLQRYFSTTNRRALEYPDDYEFQLEDVYVDITDNSLHGIVMSFLNRGYENYGLFTFNQNSGKYTLISIKRDISEIDENRYKPDLLPSDFVNYLFKHIINANFKDLVPINKNKYVDLYEMYSVNTSILSSEVIKYLKHKTEGFLLAKQFLGCHSFDYRLAGASIDINNINFIYFYSVYITLEGKKYKIELTNNGDVEELDEINVDIPSRYFKAIVEYTTEKVVSGGIKEIEAENFKELKLQVFDLIKNKYSSLEPSLDLLTGKVFFKNFSKSFLTLADVISLINVNFEHGNSIGDILLYKDVLDDNNTLFKKIDSALENTKKLYDNFVERCQKFIDYKVSVSGLALENAIFDLKNNSQRVFDFFVDKAELEEYFEKAQDAYKEVKNMDKKKIDNILGSIVNIKDEKKFNKDIEDLSEKIENLSDLEKAYVSTQYQDLLNKYAYLDDYHANRPLIRKVFIRKKVLRQLIDLSKENTELKIMGIVDSIVEKLKTIPGNELVSYLHTKGLNQPIENDRSIKKIRIMTNFKYRLAFIYGSELGKDRSDNADDIYIFGITDHGKDKASLLKLAEQKPTKYKANEFVLYTKNKNIKIPECSNVQQKISNSYVDNPTITFGCAGSGKTTVSIEQYVNIVYSNFYPNIPTSEELVYVTYNKGLAEKAKRDLSEYNIEGNCYSLFDYFAHVLDVSFAKDSKYVNEKTFVEWFNKYYSEKELKKNLYKRKENISALNGKTDKARLIYTYYRGIFRGSRTLYNNKSEEYLSEKEFLSAVENEIYLSEEEKKSIYTICVDFYNYATTNNYIGDNELALQLLRNKNKLKKTNCIIIDEVQDLTEIEILAIILTLNESSKKIYYYGDPNQSINPNIFDGSTINKIYSLLKDYESIESKPLDISYRTNCHLISYLQKLEALRTEWIGLNKDSRMSINTPSDDLEQSTSWAAYVVVPTLFNDIIEAATSNPNCVIITPSDEAKEQLIARYPNVVKERVISIYEAKGMEWETVIMYNMFTDYNTYFMDMVSNNGNAKKSTIHRMTFNKYYVGCTRSTKSFILLEENHDVLTSEHPIFANLISEFAPIFKKDQLNTFINEENTFDGWYAEAMQNLENDNDAMFKHALYHAERLATTEEEKQKIAKLSERNPEYLFNLGKTFLDQGDYAVASGLFTKCYHITKENGEYMMLAKILSNRKIKDADLMRYIRKNKSLLDQYPQAYLNLINREYIKSKLFRSLQKFYVGRNNKEEDK